MRAGKRCAVFVGWIVVLLGARAGGADLGAYDAAISSIRTDDLKRHVDVLSDDVYEGREAGSRGGRSAADYLRKQLYDSGLAAAGDDGDYYQSFADGYRNLLGLIEGSDPDLKAEYIVVGAHYDHVGFGTSRNSAGPVGYIHNGADDNASGTAAVLEIIEAFSSTGLAPKRSILFALWDSEERGLLGSRHWVDNPTVPLARVPAAVNIDMVGRLREHRLEIGGSRTSWGFRRLMSGQTRGTDLQLDFTWKIRSNSDHWPFYERNIPIVMLHTGLHDDYHRPSDDANLVNAEGMREVTQFLFASVVALADAEHLRGFRHAAREESPAMQRNLERPDEPAPRRLGVRWADEQASDRGLLLSHIFADSAAERGGLRAGDRVQSFAGRLVRNGADLRSAVLAASSEADVVVERAGAPEPQTVKVTLSGGPVTLGVSWREDEAEPSSVLLTRVIAGSPADRAGLKARDRIYQVDGADFAGGDELLRYVRQATGELELLVETSGRLRTVEVELLPRLEPLVVPTP